MPSTRSQGQQRGVSCEYTSGQSCELIECDVTAVVRKKNSKHGPAYMLWTAGEKLKNETGSTVTRLLAMVLVRPWL